MADILQRSVARYGSNTGKFLGAGEGGVGVGCVGGVGEGVDLHLSTFQVPRLDLEGMLQIGKERLTIARCSPSSPRYEGHIGGVGRVISWEWIL